MFSSEMGEVRFCKMCSARNFSPNLTLLVTQVKVGSEQWRFSRSPPIFGKVPVVAGFMLKVSVGVRLSGWLTFKHCW